MYLFFFKKKYINRNFKTMSRRRTAKLVTCQLLYELPQQVLRDKLLAGDIVELSHGYKVMLAENIWHDCMELEIVQQVCDLFEDPVSAYDEIALKHPLKLKIDINHPCTASYIGKFDKRWCYVEISMQKDFTGVSTEKNLCVWYSKNFHSSGLSGYSFRIPCPDVFQKLCWLTLEKLLRPKVEVIFSAKERFNFASCCRIPSILPQLCVFPDKSVWQTGNGIFLYKMVESIHDVANKWDTVKTSVGNRLVNIIFSPTCYEMEFSPVLNPRYSVSHNTKLASQYVHKIILDVCLCFYPICPAPYVLLWIFNQCPVTKHDYIRKRIHVIEKIYESIRKVCENRTNKRAKI